MFVSKSPCNGMCESNSGKDVCIGCMRTMIEIQNWKTMGVGQQQEIWQRLSQRRIDYKGLTKVRDQLKREIVWPSTIKKIVSLVPSLTQTLVDLGLEHKIIGATEYCPHLLSPHCDFELIGGTKNPDLVKIIQLKPDVVVANKEENTQRAIQSLGGELPVWVSDVNTLYDSSKMVERLGEYLYALAESQTLIAKCSKGIDEVKGIAGSQRGLYLIWKAPYMAAAKNTFIDAWLAHLGIQNVLDEEQRYPKLSIAKIKRLDPQVIFLPDEPYKFSTSCGDEINHILPAAKIRLVSGQHFSWFGTSTASSCDYFKTIFT